MNYTQIDLHHAPVGMSGLPYLLFVIESPCDVASHRDCINTMWSKARTAILSVVFGSRRELATASGVTYSTFA